jgi:MFS family permease
MENHEHPDLMTSLRALPRAAWFVFVGTFINRMGTLVMPFITIYLTRHEFTVSEAGWALMSYGGGNLAATLIGGHLADSIGRKNTMLISLFSTSVVMCLLPQAETVIWIYTLMFCTGLTGEIYRPAVNALIADIVPEEHRLTAYAANRTALNAGFAFGPSLGGLMAHYSWSWLFYADAFTTAIYALIALYALPHGRRSNGQGGSSAAIWREIAKNGAFLMFALATFFVAVTFMQMNATFPLLVVDCGYEPWVFGIITSFNGLLVVLIELPLTSITRRFSARSVITVGYFLIGAGMALAAFASTVPMFFVVMTVFTIGEIISMPMVPTYLARVAPADRRGRYMGIFGLTWALALLLGPKIGLAIYESNPVEWWYLCGVFGVLAALLMYFNPVGSKDRE